MDDMNDEEKYDVIMPGFRFHPTDEELVGFYLKRKLEQRPLPIELIKQVDIYKYDPWDLPKLASTGEKESYFYCPRDRKYRNSTRPNRVTGSGFWKATGTDRPICSSDGTKCIGLKKSLVFYRGRAARGIKTDWMMHEFRLPSTSDTATPKKFLNKNLPASDSWAICRIFKKSNSTAQRAISQSWGASLSEIPCVFTEGAHHSQFTEANISPISETRSTIQLCSSNESRQPSPTKFSARSFLSHKPMEAMTSNESIFTTSNGDLPPGYFMFSPPEEETGSTNKCTLEVPSMLFNLSPALISDMSKITECNELERPQQEMQGSITLDDNEGDLRTNQCAVHIQNQWQSMRQIGFPFSLPSTVSDSSKLNLPWDSPPCPSEIATSCSANKFYA
ncbi:Hypothetical predicted protein [Olea europaea subsp. europaea]|uniref:NAC domain-containing protein n=1 Tax=Olea europaea subsp. europaea TaxID=158383 RepID=A0A8S0U5D0_OLEEU|nr:Hypothetical predicted protein [Olea europaea subsp. europaea]